MRRRELLAGALGAGVVAAGGAVAIGGVPSFDGEPATNASGGAEPVDPEPTRPIEVEAIDARGSEAGTLTIPLEDRLTVLTFFATTCEICASKMPSLAEAADEFAADEVGFVSVTTEPVGDGVPESTVVDWFESHGGDWTLAYDPVSELSVAYDGIPYPKTVVADADGRVWWEHRGDATSEELVAGIEGALEGASADGVR